MTPFECYCDYVALRNHFNQESYDYIKYNGKVRLTFKNFESRKDKFFFEKLSKHENPHALLLSNFIRNKKLWIRDLAFSEECEKNYKEWLKRKQSFTYLFKQDLSKLETNFNDNFLIIEHEHPPLLRKYLSGDISLETLCLLLELTGAVKQWSQKLEYDIVWNETKQIVNKYTPFIDIDRKRVKNICVEYFT